MRELSLLVLITGISLCTLNAHCQMHDTATVTIQVFNNGISKYVGHADSSSGFLSGIGGGSISRLYVESMYSRIPSGLIELVRRTSISGLTLSGFGESEINLILSSVADPSKVTSVTLGNTTLAAVPGQLRRYSSLRDIFFDTLACPIPCWFLQEMVMLDNLFLNRGTTELPACDEINVNACIFIEWAHDIRGPGSELDSIFIKNGVWIQTLEHYTSKTSRRSFDLYNQIDVWTEDGVNLGRMDFDHCGVFGTVMWDQIVHCLNDRVPFADKDTARCTEYLELVRTKRVLRLDLVPEGVLIERTFLVTGNQAKRLRRFIDCSWE